MYRLEWTVVHAEYKVRCARSLAKLKPAVSADALRLTREEVCTPVPSADALMPWENLPLCIVTVQPFFFHHAARRWN